jgi:hypothetical protein
LRRTDPYSGALPPIEKHVEEEIANEFQARLLGYFLRNFTGLTSFAICGIQPFLLETWRRPITISSAFARTAPRPKQKRIEFRALPTAGPLPRARQSWRDVDGQ